jgi:pimeloyl-ACP methyl ester carboxylesterase
VGYRIAAKHPERIESLIIQNGNAYEEGLREFWDPIKAYWKKRSKENAAALRDSLLTIEATKWQYTNGVRNPETIAPENWFNDQYLIERPGNKDIQLKLFYDYGSNPPLWGKNDFIFPEEGAHPYKRDLNNIEFHLFDTGHFALEEDGDKIADLITCFMAKNTDLLARHPETWDKCAFAA